MTTRKTTADEDRKPVVDMTDDDFFGTLTGFEELAIEQKFNTASIAALRGTTYVRALVFVHQAREKGGVADKAAQTAAKKHAMGLTIRDLATYFAPDPEPANPDSADAEGNGDELPDEQPDSDE